MLARFDEEGAAVLQLADTICCGFTGLLGDEGAHLVVVHLALPRFEAGETVGDDSLAVGGGKQRVTKSDDAA